MQKKEEKLCIWIHHIATVLGWLWSLHSLQDRRIRGWKKGILAGFALSQTWAVSKLLAGFLCRQEKLRKSIARIRKLCKSERKTRGVLIGVTAASALFKLGIPWAFAVRR